MSTPSTPVAPIAAQKPHQHKKHGDLREDPYFWLNQREDPQVLDYLKAENAYYQAMTAHTLPLQEALFAEMKGRIKEDDRSVPYKKNGYWYGVRYELGQQYPVYFRHKGELDAPEEILFDVNEMAEGQEYFHMRGIAVSPDNKLVSYGVDTVSRRQYQIRIKDLRHVQRPHLQHAPHGSRLELRRPLPRVVHEFLVSETSQLPPLQASLPRLSHSSCEGGALP